MPDEPLSTAEIARMFGVQPGTVHSWRQRGVFPDPDRSVSNTPIWFSSTVTAWAQSQGRRILQAHSDDDLALIARQVEQGISSLGEAVARAAGIGGDAGWHQATAAIADALIPLSQVVTELARVRDADKQLELNDADDLKLRARNEIRTLVQARFRNWARLSDGELEALADAAWHAAMDPSLDLTYPVEGEDDVALYFSEDLRGVRIQSDGRRDTLERIGREHRRLVSVVRSWDVWRRIRPGPL